MHCLATSMMQGGQGSLSGWQGWLVSEACPQERMRVQVYLHLGMGVPHGMGACITVRPQLQDKLWKDVSREIKDVRGC